MAAERGAQVAFAAGNAHELLAKGWGVVPTKPGTKEPAVPGITGWKGEDAPAETIDAWANDPVRAGCGTAIRMAVGTIGLDVDDYDGKRGAASLEQLIEQFGELPPTWSTTARGPGQPSRISFYRVPAWATFHSAPAPGIEVIQRHHRVAMVLPSINPKTGTPYGWYDPHGVDVDEAPNVEDLAELPWPWTEGLQAVKSAGADAVTLERALAFLDVHREGRKPDALGAVMSRLRCGVSAQSDPLAVRAPASRHDALVQAACWAAREAAAGWYPARDAFDALLAWWLEVMDDRARRGTSDAPSSEFLAAWQWAVAQAESEPERITKLRSAVADEERVGARESFELTDLGNARRLVARHGDRLRYVAEHHAWFAWDGARWVEDVSGEVHRSAKAVVDSLVDEANTPGIDPAERTALVKHWAKSQHSARLAAMVDVARTERQVVARVAELDADPFALNVANGTLDLRTGSLHPHDRGGLHTKLAPVAYDPSAAAPTWLRFLGDVFAPHPELVEFWQRWCGYSLTGDVSEQAFVFGHGHGSNGKGVLVSALQRVWGDYGCTLDPRLLMASAYDQHPTGLTDLRGARFAVTSETEQGAAFGEALIKRLTGGDAISARRMRGDYFTFPPTHKLVIVGNHLPTIRGTDHAMWRRVLLVPFEVTFDGERRDPQLLAKVTSELPGILAWAVAGCLQWQENGLRVPAVVRATTDAYRAAEDHLGHFLADCTVADRESFVSAHDLRHRYEFWCSVQGERPWTPHAVGAALRARGFASVTHARARSWRGLRLTSPA